MLTDTSILVGFSVTPAELAAQITNYLSTSAATGWANLGQTIGALKSTDLRWANPLELKNAVEAAFAEKFGAKEAAKPKGKVRAYRDSALARKCLISRNRNPRRKLHPRLRPPPSHPTQLRRRRSRSSRKVSSDVSTSQARTPSCIPNCASNTLPPLVGSSTPVSLLSPTVSCTLVTPRLFSSTSAMPHTTAANAICVTTTRTRRRRRLSISRVSWRLYGGLALSLGKSRTRATTSTSCMR